MQSTSPALARALSTFAALALTAVCATAQSNVSSAGSALNRAVRSADIDSLLLTNESTTQFGYGFAQPSPGLAPRQLTLECWFEARGAGFGSTQDHLGAGLCGRGLPNSLGFILVSYALSWSPGTQRIVAALSHQIPNQGIFLFSNSLVAPGQLTHVAMTYDGEQLRLYINGELDNETVFPYPSIGYGEHPFGIGAGNFAGSFVRRFDGTIDEVRLWDRARSESMIAGSMNCALTGTEPGLLAYWNFDNGSLADQSGLGHDLTPAGPGVGFTSQIRSVGNCSPSGPRGSQPDGLRLSATSVGSLSERALYCSGATPGALLCLVAESSNGPGDRHELDPGMSGGTLLQVRRADGGGQVQFAYPYRARDRVLRVVERPKEAPLQLSNPLRMRP